MKELNRIKVGRFNISDAITIEKLENNIEEAKAKIIQMEEFFKDLPAIYLDNKHLEKFLNGMLINNANKDGIYNIYSGKYIGIGIIKDNELKRDIVI